MSQISENREVRVLMGAVLNRLHMTLGYTENNQLGQNLVSAAIPHVLYCPLQRRLVRYGQAR